MSGRRSELLVNNEIYHVFNRSVADEGIFKGIRSLNRILNLIDFYRFPQKYRFSFFKRLPLKVKENYLMQIKKLPALVEIYAYAFMPTHYHLLLMQTADRGIGQFVANFQNSFAKYHNLLRNRHGPVFSRPFKAKRVSSDNEFLHIGRYIHLNPVTSFLITPDELENYPYNSFMIYQKKVSNNLINTNPTLKLVRSRSKYVSFIHNQIDYQKKLNIIKHLLME